MSELNSRFYADVLEAMNENKLTVKDVAAVRGVHYSYIYNAIKKRQNLTMDSVDQLTHALGYRARITLEPFAAGRTTIKGDYACDAPFYLDRADKKARGKTPAAPAATLLPSNVDEELRLPIVDGKLYSPSGEILGTVSLASDFLVEPAESEIDAELRELMEMDDDEQSSDLSEGGFL